MLEPIFDDDEHIGSVLDLSSALDGLGQHACPHLQLRRSSAAPPPHFSWCCSHLRSQFHLLDLEYMHSRAWHRLNKRKRNGRSYRSAEALAADIDRELDRAIVVLETLTSSEPLKRRDWRAFHAQAVAALRRTEAAIVVIDRDYQQVVDTLKVFGAELPKTADIVTARRVFETKERQVSNLFMGSISGRPVFNVEVPVIEGDDVPYVLIMSFRATYIAEVLRAARLPEPWITGVTDNNGIILARSERHEEFVGKPLPSHLLEQSRTATGVFTSISAAGVPIARATVRSQIAGWLVSATVPLSYVEAPASRIQGFALWMIGTAIALGIGLAYIFGGFMARSLTAATDAARRVGQGQAVAPLRTPLVEANILTATLSTAAHELQAATSDLTRQKEHTEFLMGELAHRSKNQLAVIRGMAQQTARQSDSVPEFVAHFVQRIQGLAQSHDLLLRQDWQGAWLNDLLVAHLDLFGIRPARAIGRAAHISECPRRSEPRVCAA